MAVVNVAANLERVYERIRSAGGDPAGITVVAVTKQLPADAVSAAAQAGLLDIGENYAQQVAAKAASAPPGVRWHLLSPPQRNKVRLVAPLVHLWQAVDRPAAADAIAKHAPGARVLVQVNVADQRDKHGSSVAEAPALVDHARAAGLDVRGLMAVGPLGPAENARAGFHLLASIARNLGLAELSMGMSGDLEVAIQEGATIVRIGTALLGPRPVHD